MKKFKYAPQGIPTLILTEKEFEEFDKEMNRPPTEEEKAHLKHCMEVYEVINRNSLNRKHNIKEK